MITDLTRTVTVDGVDLRWDRWGSPATDGVPLLLCHGFSGSSHDFALHVDALAADREVVTIDHRGHGRSTNVGTLDAYSLDRLATDLISFVDTEIAAPVDLLGHSMGGAISLRVTLARPDLVRSLILMDTSAWSFVPEAPELAELMRAFMDRFDPTRGLPDLAALGANPEDQLIAAATPRAWQDMKLEMAAAFDPYALQALGRELFDPSRASVRARLAEIACPVTVIVGELDEPFASQAGDLAAEVADGRSIVVAGARHSPQLTHPDEWSAAVRAHLARV